MGRLPCGERIGVKKVPWSPEEDIILVSYIQEHGSRNWRFVSDNTGLHRTSDSCRLRWAKYLSPDIKHSNFTAEEEKKLIKLQALHGNRWATIAKHFPQRTDNAIKNYWHIHLKKKLNKDNCRGNEDQPTRSDDIHESSCGPNSASLTPYPFSIDNIAGLLPGWVKDTPKSLPLPHHNHEEANPIVGAKNVPSNNSSPMLTEGRAAQNQAGNAATFPGYMFGSNSGNNSFIDQTANNNVDFKNNAMIGSPQNKMGMSDDIEIPSLASIEEMLMSDDIEIPSMASMEELLLIDDSDLPPPIPLPALSPATGYEDEALPK